MNNGKPHIIIGAIILGQNPILIWSTGYSLRPSDKSKCIQRWNQDDKEIWKMMCWGGLRGSREDLVWIITICYLSCPSCVPSSLWSFLASYSQLLWSCLHVYFHSKDKETELERSVGIFLGSLRWHWDLRRGLFKSSHSLNHNWIHIFHTNYTYRWIPHYAALKQPSWSKKHCNLFL